MWSCVCLLLQSLMTVLYEKKLFHSMLPSYLYAKSLAFVMGTPVTLKRTGWLYALALENIYSNSVTFSVRQFVRGWLNTLARLNIFVILFALPTSHVLSGWLKTVASTNADSKLVTRLVSK